MTGVDINKEILPEVQIQTLRTNSLWAVADVTVRHVPDGARRPRRSWRPGRLRVLSAASPVLIPHRPALFSKSSFPFLAALLGLLSLWLTPGKLLNGPCRPVHRAVPAADGQQPRSPVRASERLSCACAAGCSKRFFMETVYAFKFSNINTYWGLAKLRSTQYSFFPQRPAI